jgi:hypothetical protein
MRASIVVHDDEGIVHEFPIAVTPDDIYRSKWKVDINGAIHNFMCWLKDVHGGYVRWGSEGIFFGTREPKL